ncbi:hypothetical protein FJ930_19655 [Mesorhizobium sp. B2-4-15]|nr:hypothetical protein FJ930_19655 [Mesorhizobium sp. B2-4-15]
MRFDGRNAWMLRKLIDAGKKGITTADLPAGVRVSHFVLCLRKRGIIISSDRVSHGGPFAGIHSVYRCEMDLTVLEEAGLAA